MFTEAAMFFFYAKTPIHAGSGSSVSHVDLPIQREKHTGYPIVQASGVKGAFRSWAEDLYKNDPKKDEIVSAFGPRNGDEHSGALAFTDAQILLFPVPSFAGGFAWITCPNILHRLFRLLKTAGIELPAIKVGNGEEDIEIPKPLATNQEAYTTDGCPLIVGSRIILEDFAFKAERGSEEAIAALADWIGERALPADKIYQNIKSQLKSRLVLLSDEHFRDFSILSTDVQTRISIGQSGTVDQGPWNEELLQSDTLLFSLALGKDVQVKNYKAGSAIKFAKDIADKGGILQLGGDETLGRGLVEVRHASAKKTEEQNHAGK